jgi:hypothetical protein
MLFAGRGRPCSSAMFVADALKNGQRFSAIQLAPADHHAGWSQHGLQMRAGLHVWLICHPCRPSRCTSLLALALLLEALGSQPR